MEGRRMKKGKGEQPGLLGHKVPRAVSLRLFVLRNHFLKFLVLWTNVFGK